MTDVAPSQSAMVRLTVRLYGIRRELIDRPEVTVVLPAEATPRQLLTRLGEEFGPRVARQLFVADGRHLGPSVCLAINDVVISPMSLDVPLSSFGGDKPDISLAVVFSIAGGSQGG